MTSQKPIMSHLFSRQIPPINLRLSLPPLHGHQLKHGFGAVVLEGGDEAHIKGSGVILSDELHRCGRGIQPDRHQSAIVQELSRGIAASGEWRMLLQRRDNHSIADHQLSFSPCAYKCAPTGPYAVALCQNPGHIRVGT